MWEEQKNYRRRSFRSQLALVWNNSDKELGLFFAFYESLQNDREDYSFLSLEIFIVCIVFMYH